MVFSCAAHSQKRRFAVVIGRSKTSHRVCRRGLSQFNLAPVQVELLCS